MNQITLSEIERTIMRLSTDEQLLLISRVAEKLRAKTSEDSDFENKLKIRYFRTTPQQADGVFARKFLPKAAKPRIF